MISIGKRFFAYQHLLPLDSLEDLADLGHLKK